MAARLGDTVAELALSRLAACIWRRGTLQKTRGGGLRSLTQPPYLEGLYPYLVHPHYQPLFHRGERRPRKGVATVTQPRTACQEGILLRLQSLIEAAVNC